MNRLNKKNIFHEKFIQILAFSLSLFIFSACESTPGVPNSSIDDIIDVTASIITSVQSVTLAMEDFSPEQEYLLGMSVANSVCKVYPPAEQSVAADYLNKICTTLTINSAYPYLYKGYHVIVVQSDDLNAISTPGGHIFITEGLLKMCTSEDELAAVIAHELAHIQLKHSINLIRSKRGTKALQSVTVSALKVKAMSDDDLRDVFSALDDSTTQITDTLFKTGFSKAQEYDADQTALKLMYDAGYNPSAMENLLNHLNENYALITPEKNKTEHKLGKIFIRDNLKQIKNRAKNISSLNGTHPAPKQRLKNVEKSIEKYKYIGLFHEKARKQRFEANKAWF